MKLGKLARGKLYRAEGKAVTLTWPHDAPEPRSGHKYSIYSESGAFCFRIVLERSKRLPYETKATVRIDGDPIRLLPGLKGVRNELGDYVPEPERIDQDTEDHYAMQAAQRSALLAATSRDVEAAERNFAKKGPGKFQREALERARRRAA